MGRLQALRIATCITYGVYDAELALHVKGNKTPRDARAGERKHPTA